MGKLAVRQPIHQGVALVDPTSALLEKVARLFKMGTVGKSEETIRSYRYALVDFANFVGEDDTVKGLAHLFSLSRGDAVLLIEEYLQDMTDRKLSSSTIRVRISAIKGRIKDAYRAEIIEWKDVDIPMPKRKATKTVAGPSPEKFAEILESISSPSREQDYRDRAIIYILAFLGLRRNEVASLDMEHLDVDKKRIWILRKGQSDRVWKTVPDETWKCIEAWIHMRGDQSGPLFLNYDPVGKGTGRYTASSIWRMVKKLGEGVGIPNLHPHAFRHFSITEVLELTDGNILHAQKHSGHSDPRMLNVYEDARSDVAGKMASMIEKKYVKKGKK